MKLRLPPHIGWPLFVVGLLSLNVVAVLVTVVAARSDEGAQVIEDYYRKAVDWDAAVARQAASDALGWQVDLTVKIAEAPGRPRPVEITVRDRNGAPVEQLRGTVRAFRPQRVQAVAASPLTAVPGAPGVYRQPFSIPQAGLWDFEIVATRDTLHFQTKIRKEVMGISYW